jgi:hypothetical protein
MAKVLTIRDPKTGYLIAEEWLRPREDKDAALVRVYRKTLGPEAPEHVILTHAIWLDDQAWAADIAKDWGSFSLSLLGPKDDPKPEKSRLVLVRISEREPGPRMEFPSEKEELDAMKHGRKRDAIVPARPEDPPAVGDRVRFVQWVTDPFGNPIRAENGDSICVDLTEVRNEGEKWVGQDIYYIAWDPAHVRKLPKKADAHRSK